MEPNLGGIVMRAVYRILMFTAFIAVLASCTSQGQRNLDVHGTNLGSGEFTDIHPLDSRLSSPRKPKLELTDTKARSLTSGRYQEKGNFPGGWYFYERMPPGKRYHERYKNPPETDFNQGLKWFSINGRQLNNVDLQVKEREGVYYDTLEAGNRNCIVFWKSFGSSTYSPDSPTSILRGGLCGADDQSAAEVENLVIDYVSRVSA